jgi:hypothetical protein
MRGDGPRRRFLTNAAGIAAGGTALALATINSARVGRGRTYGRAGPDIQPDRGAAYLVALEEQNRLDRFGDLDHDWVADGQCCADMEAFEPLPKKAPTKLAGFVAWASFLDKIARHDGEAWMFEEEGTTLVATLVEALGNLAVASCAEPA